MTSINFVSQPIGANVKLIGSTTPTPVGRVSPCPPKGDILGDGYVGQDDVDALREYLTGTRTLTQEQMDRADVTGRGKVYSVDLMYIEAYFKYIFSTFGSCGTPPAFPEILPSVTSSDLSQFRSECIQNGEISVGWSTLRPWMISRKVGALWWDLTITERKSICDIAVSNVLKYTIDGAAGGDPNCKERKGIWEQAVCRHNATVRCMTFGFPVWGSDYCYYRYLTTAECYYTKDYFGLPTYRLEMVCKYLNKPAVGHAMAAIKIEKNPTSVKGFYVFQYKDQDIQIGDWQMPCYDNYILEIKKIIWLLGPDSTQSNTIYNFSTV